MATFTISISFNIETVFATAAEDDAFKAQYVMDDINICQVMPTTLELEVIIKRGMKEAGPKLDRGQSESIYPALLAEDILTVTHCFGIDPIIMVGLLGSESLYINDIKNSIGATGLGQLLPNALEEIGLQLGAPGAASKYDYAPLAQRKYFESAINCSLELDHHKRFVDISSLKDYFNLGININYEEKLSMQHWWELQSMNDLRIKRKMNSKVEKILRTNRLTNLIYSSMILKIFYSRARSKYKLEDIDSITLDQWNMIMLDTVTRYKGSNPTQGKYMHKRARQWSNRMLEVMGETKNACYRPKYGR